MVLGEETLAVLCAAVHSLLLDTKIIFLQVLRIDLSLIWLGIRFAPHSRSSNTIGMSSKKHNWVPTIRRIAAGFGRPKQFMAESIVMRVLLCVGALAGPVLADEVINRRPTAMVVGTDIKDGSKNLKSFCILFNVESITDDMLGVGLASAMNKGIGIALGIVDGLRQGVGVRGL